jgi:hypothetical protein
VTEPQIPKVHTLDVAAANEVPFRIVVLADGVSVSRPAANKYNKDDKALVEFYDRRYQHTPDGQFICCYHLDVLLPDGEGGTFVLWGDVPNWRIDGATMEFIRSWLCRFA